jgi:hypothetical protein
MNNLWGFMNRTHKWWLVSPAELNPNALWKYGRFSGDPRRDDTIAQARQQHNQNGSCLINQTWRDN